MNAPVDSAYGLGIIPCINRFVDEDHIFAQFGGFI